MSTLHIRMFRTSIFWICSLSILGLASSATAAPQSVKAGVAPQMTRRMTAIDRLPPTQRLKLAISLPLRNEAALDQLLHDLYDPNSPSYRQYLTPQQFTEKFGPAEQDYEGLMHFAKTNGLSLATLHPNRVVLDVEGTVGAIEKAFHVNLRVYNHPTESRTFFAPDADPTIDLPFKVLSVAGLDNFSVPKPRHKIEPLDQGTITPRGGSGPSGSYRGNDFRAAYVPGTTLTGAGQSVGLLQFDGYYAVDISNYIAQAALPSVLVTNVPVGGGVSSPGSGNGEVCLDIEMVLSMAPGVSNIYVYEAPNPSPWIDLLSRMANDNLCKQLSCSWGGGGPDDASEQIFKQMAAQGQSFFSASGDSDALTGAIDFPGESTNITQVGGTTLSTTGPGGAFVSETVWNRGNDVGSSGGVSVTYPIPSYQMGIDMSANGGSTIMRNIPDVALTAENVYVTYNNGSSGRFGGTSCAAPLWAGFAALMNQQAATAGRSSLGFVNPAIYSVAKSAKYGIAFHDTTSGDNTSSSSPSLYYAATGYDLCTGWGSPAGTNLINLLAGPPSTSPLIVSNGFVLANETCTNGVIDAGETVTANFSLKNIGVSSTSNLIATLLSSGGVVPLSGPQSYGSLPNGAAVTLPFTFTAIGTCGGTNTAALQLQDGTNNLGTVSFSFPLGQLIATPVFSESFDGPSAPALPAGWATTASGAQSAWLSSTVYRDTIPNAAYSTDATAVGLNELDSPSIALPAGAAQLSFRHKYDLESSYDGGVLEIQTGAGAWTDILAAGGSFATGPYVSVLSTISGNPLGGRRAWTGNSGGFITSVVNLPPSASGQSIRLRWRCGTDESVGKTGWYVDSLAISNLTYVCCSSTPPPSVTATISAGAMNLQWNAQIGRSYQIQYKSDLSANTWTNLGSPITASSSTISIADPITTAPQRFYRLVLLP